MTHKSSANYSHNIPSALEATAMLLLAGFRLAHARPDRIRVPAWLVHALRRERGLAADARVLIDDGKVEVVT